MSVLRIVVAVGLILLVLGVMAVSLASGGGVGGLEAVRVPVLAQLTRRGSWPCGDPQAVGQPSAMGVRPRVVLQVQ